MDDLGVPHFRKPPNWKHIPKTVWSDNMISCLNFTTNPYVCPPLKYDDSPPCSSPEMLLVVEIGFRFVPRKKAFLKIRTLQGFGFPIFPIQNYVNHRCLMLGSPISTKHQMLIVNRLRKATLGCKVLRFYNDFIGISKDQQTGMLQKISGTQRQGVSCGSYLQLILHRNKQSHTLIWTMFLYLFHSDATPYYPSSTSQRTQGSRKTGAVNKNGAR